MTQKLVETLLVQRESYFTDFSDLRKYRGKPVYIFIYEKIFVGTTSLTAMNSFMERSKAHELHATEDQESNDELMVLYGIPLDVENLPYEIKELAPKASFWALHNMYSNGASWSECFRLEEATEKIEGWYKEFEEYKPETEDMAILCGFEPEFYLQIKKPIWLEPGKGYGI